MKSLERKNTIFIVSLFISAVIVVLGIAFPVGFEKVAQGLFNYIGEKLG